jgi:monoamine oxidase
VEGFNAAHAERISVHSLVDGMSADEQLGPDRQYRILDGYARIPEALLSECVAEQYQLCLNTLATHVVWRRREVRVTARTGSSAATEFTAPCAIITLPLPVLRARADGEGAIRFRPALRQKSGALSQLEMGGVLRVTLRLRERIWRRLPARAKGDPGDIGFLFSNERPFPTWWTANPHRAPVITGWASGPNAELVAGHGERYIFEQALQTLARLLGMERRALEAQVASFHAHDWQADRFSRGAYSYALVGGSNASQELAAPLSGTLFFAGEATDSKGHSGTVHGAISSGVRAATEVLTRAQN